VNIAAQFQKVFIGIDEDGFVASLVEVAVPVMTTVVIYRVGRIESLHQFTEIGLGGLDNEVKVVVHKDVTVERYLEGFQARVKNVEEGMPVGIILKDLFPFISPAGDVIKGTGVFYAKRSCHGVPIPCSQGLVNSQRLTPYYPSIQPSAFSGGFLCIFEEYS